MEAIEISSALLEKLSELRREGGYPSLGAGLEKAVEHHLGELRRQKAEKISNQVRQGLTKRRHTEDEVLKDFEAFRERLDGGLGPARCTRYPDRLG